MDTSSSFLAMGGYAAFIWPAYILSAVVLLGLWIESLRRLRERQRALVRLEAEMPSRRDRRAAAPDTQGAGSEGGPA
jgi:heme exporter protein D